MTLDDPELDGGRADGRHYFQIIQTSITPAVYNIDMMFGSRLGFSGSADLLVQLSKFKNPRWRLTAMLDIQKWP